MHGAATVTTLALTVALLAVILPPDASAEPPAPPAPASSVASTEPEEPGEVGPRWAHDPRVERLAGPDRVHTAVAVSGATFTDGADHAVLATGTQYPDALAGSALAGAAGGPVLLTRGDDLEPTVSEELDRLSPDRVTVLGGEQAVPAAVETTLDDRGIDVDRVRGADRFDTAAQVAERVANAVGGSPGRAYVVEGQHADPQRGWPDATATAGLAASEREPVLLTRHDRLPSVTVDALSAMDVDELVIIGGSSAVSGSVADELERIVGAVTRVAGTDRWETSAAIAERSVDAGLDGGHPWVVSGRDWPDALAAGPAAAQRGGPLLLTDGRDWDLAAPSARWLTDAGVSSATVVGGTGAVGEVAARDVEALARAGEGDVIRTTAAGDIACDPEWDWDPVEECRHADTAELAAGADWVFALGDLQYNDATIENLQASYDPTWGEFRERTLPVPGNHEYYRDSEGQSSGARGYFEYFEGHDIGEPFAGYYERELGYWQVLAIDSNCRSGVDCEPDGEQARWLRERLEASDQPCTLAFMHHTAFSSSPRHGDDPYVRPLLEEMEDAGVDVLLTAHAHKYERMRRADASGGVDVDDGMRVFVVGTGGVNLHPFAEQRHHLQVTGTDAHFGVLELDLHDVGYQWEFAAVDDPQLEAGEFTDAGFGSCG
ncbi:cell wall-binding repeat-containing protein [Egibacter rhizosphaerae]|uniref:cell wall-binding repeat-containing protein n=1 Tax=Egibacter rhizosphaerae TaxID=1670831 RepID=UPI0013F17CDC|nr:cell wall-binding repeat-containing protein [Egibacter rhizosphaerae]